MGVLNPRAICPNCGAKIHTQQSILPGSKRTGTVCPQCGVKLTGTVGFDNKAKVDERPSVAEVLGEIGDLSRVTGIVIPPKKKRWLKMWLDNSNVPDSKSLIAEIKAGRSIEVRPESDKDLEKLVRNLTGTGFEYEVIREPREGEESGFGVMLTDAGDKKVKVIQAVKKASGLGLREVKALVDSAPKPVAENAKRSKAENLIRTLEEAGATVEMITPEDAASPVIQPEAVSESDDVFAQIEKLGQLHEAGALTDEEFQAKKAELLERL